MSLPTTKFFPTRKNLEDPKEISKYVVDMVYELERMYDALSDTVNGSMKSSYLTQREKWTPILKGTTNAGSFTYTNSIGWVFRQGLLVDVWADIAWTAAGGATGSLYVELPYKVATTDQKPFVGVVQTSSIPYGGGHSYLTVNAISSTYRGEFFGSGSGVATANLVVPASGQLIFHLRYIGVQDER